MTLPNTTVLPVHSDKIKEGGEGLDGYIQDLVFTLQRQYEDTANAVNGDYRTSSETGSRQFIPTVRGASTQGAGTYTTQNAWVLRKGILVDFWFNIVWTGHTGTGTLQIDLPYIAAQTDGNLFTGTVYTESLSFTGVTYGIVDDSARTMRIQQSQSGGSVANIAVATAGTLKGHVRYVGQSIERS
jgi:hypothetical protein